MEYHKCSQCDNKAHWLLMSGNNGIELDSYCDNCVPKGCSCNSESFYFDDGDDKNEQVEEFLKPGRKMKVLNYGQRLQEKGKHLEEIKDMLVIKNMFYKFTEEELLYLEIIPLDENGEEYPCCEFMWYEKGVEID